MNVNLKNLQYAFKHHLLINIYQKNSTIFYTGVVKAMDNHSVIVSTFDDSGLSDGEVYLDLDVIYGIEFNSSDLALMQQRIKIANEENLVEVDKSNVKINNKNDLLTQVLGNSFVDQQPIMVVDDLGVIHEGLVLGISDDYFEMKTFDKFDNHNHKTVHISKENVEVIEFLGNELTLLGQSFKQLFSHHLPPHQADTPNSIYANLQAALESGQRVVMIPKLNSKLFFIGQVIALNDKETVLKLVNMAGQFGGYIAVSLDNIKKLVTKSDYLKLINHFVAVNLGDNTYLQPVLNDERNFDSTTNLFLEIINQAITFKRVIRLQLSDGANILGIPMKINDNKMKFEELDDNKCFVKKIRTIDLNSIKEIAFEYLDAYLVKKQLLIP